MTLNEINEVELILNSTKERQGLFRKYGFLRILLNTVTLDTNAWISKSTLTFVIGAISFDMN